MNEIEIDLSKCIDNFKIDKDKAKQYGGYKKIANDLSKENIKLAFENTILQSKIDKVNRILNANTHVENIYHALCNLFDEEYQYEIDNEELNKILKEDK